MRELVEFVVRGLVDQPDEVSVTETQGGRETIAIEIRVAQHDTGKIIGKGGKIAAAIRTVAKTAAARRNQRVFVDIAS